MGSAVDFCWPRLSCPTLGVRLHERGGCVRVTASRRFVAAVTLRTTLHSIRGSAYYAAFDSCARVTAADGQAARKRFHMIKKFRQLKIDLDEEAGGAGPSRLHPRRPTDRLRPTIIHRFFF